MDYRAPATPPPSSPAAATKKRPFAYQAAQLSMWAPIIGLALGCLINLAFSNRTGSAPLNTAYVWTGLVGFNIALNALAVVMGIVALLMMPKTGKAAVIWRSIVGICLGGAMLTFIGTALLGPNLPDLVAKRITGEWDGTVRLSEVDVKTHLSLRTDKRASVTLTGGAQSISAQGQWSVTFDPNTKKPSLYIRFNPGQTAMGGAHLWQIDSAKDDELTLLDKRAEGGSSTQIFRRAK